MDPFEQIVVNLRALTEQIEALKATLPDNTQDYSPGRIVKFDHEKHLVYAEIYLPDVPDAHGHEMTASEIEKMAHGFMARASTMKIDVNHDNKTDYGLYMVESFIARKGDPDYGTGAWVGVVFVDNDEIWKRIKDGDLTGFSFEGLGYVVENAVAA